MRTQGFIYSVSVSSAYRAPGDVLGAGGTSGKDLRLVRETSDTQVN